MTTTTPTPTIELADIYHYAGDFLARTDITLHGFYVYPRSIGLMLNDEDYLSLRNVFALLDGGTVGVQDHDTDDAHSVIVHVDGQYRGVRASAQFAVTDPADLDLIRSFVDENGKPNLHLLDALAGDAR